MKTKRMNLRSSEEWRDEEGKCAMLAIAYAFKLCKTGTKYAFKLAGVRNPNDGATTEECKKVINILSNLTGKTWKYTKAKKGYGVEAFAKDFKKGEFILDLDGHVACAKNGVIIDDWSTCSFPLVGWFELIDLKAIAEQQAKEKEKQRIAELEANRLRMLERAERVRLQRADIESFALRVGRAIHEQFLSTTK